jgi:hypothetical protein
MSSDSDEFKRRAYRRLQHEIAELDTPRARYQSQLNKWWADRLAAAEEERRIRRQIDPFNLGIWN